MGEEPFSIRFRKARQRRKLTQTAAASALGISQSAIAQWESGRNYPSTDLAAKIERLLGVRFHVGERTAKASSRGALRERAVLPIIGMPAQGDDERILVDDLPHGEIAAPPQLETVVGARAVYVRGRTMEPRYYPGEVVYLHPGRPANPGDFVFLTLKESGFPTSVGYIRRYLGEDLMHIRVQTLNPKREHLLAKQSVTGVAVIVGSGLL